MQTVIASFDEISRAQEAIDALLQRNYDKADISYVARDVVSGEPAVNDAKAPSATGAVLGLLAGLGSFMIPAVGPILAAGPLTVGLAGTGAGAAQEDWLGGALAGLGVAPEDARAYTDAIGRGGALVLVRAREVVVENITAVLRSSGAAAVESHIRDDAS